VFSLPGLLFSALICSPPSFCNWPQRFACFPSPCHSTEFSVMVFEFCRPRTSVASRKFSRHGEDPPLLTSAILFLKPFLLIRRKLPFLSPASLPLSQFCVRSWKSHSTHTLSIQSKDFFGPFSRTPCGAKLRLFGRIATFHETWWSSSRLGAPVFFLVPPAMGAFLGRYVSTPVFF